MNLSFSTIKADFLLYLQEQEKIKEPDKNTDLNDIDIFAYTAEFQEFMTEEMDIDLSDMTININDLITQNADLESEVDSEEVFPNEMWNELFENEELMELFDKNNDGNIDEESMAAFILYLIENSQNNTVTMEDISSGIEKLKNGEINLDETKVPDAGTVGEYKGSKSSNDIARVTSTNLMAEMDQEALQAKLGDRKGKLEESKKTYQQIKDGSHPGISTRQDSVDKWNEIYKTQLEKAGVSEELINQIDEYTQKVVDAQEAVQANTEQIGLLQANESQAQTTYDNAVASRESLEHSLANAEGRRDALSGFLNSAEEKDKASVQAEIDALDAQIEQIKTEIATAQQAENDAKDALGKAQQALQDERDKTQGLNNALTTAEAEKLAFETDATNFGQEVQALAAEARQNYDRALKELHNFKNEAIETANANVLTCQNDVNKIETKMSKNNDRDKRIEYLADPRRKAILEMAKSQLGINEADGSADKYLTEWGSSSEQVGWCSAFVEYVMSNCEASGEMPEWFNEASDLNGYWQVNYYNHAKNAGAMVDASQVQPGDVVFFDYDGDGSPNHIAIVYDVYDGQVITIDGNSGNQVQFNGHDADKLYGMTFATVMDKHGVPKKSEEKEIEKEEEIEK